MRSTIAITKGLKASDTIFEDIPIDGIEEYLKTNTSCYERTLPITTQPGEEDRGDLNRAYVDLDGYAGEMTREQFDTLLSEINKKLM
jgi:hypothetical protein